jgi:hypothetical protein
MANPAENYLNWEIACRWSGDVSLPREAEATRDGRILRSYAQTDSEAIERVKAQIRLAESSGS